MNKTLKSTLSFAVVFCMLFSIMAIGVSAASAAHTATITASAATGKAGDTVTVSVNLDSTTNISALGYRLKYDTDAFEVDTTLLGSGANKYPACYDGEWFNSARAGDIVLFGYLGKPTLGVDTVNGDITVTASSADGVDVADNEPDVLIGKFYLKVKADAPAGATQITLIEAETIDGGETLGTPIAFTPITFTVEGEVVKSDDADLTDLTAAPATLAPAFGVDTLAYTATVANGVESVTIAATKSDSKATVTGEGVKALTVGSNSFDVVVTAEDTTVTKTYSIAITREAPAVVTHTVTFMADGSTVATKTVNYGTTLTDIPAVPGKTGFNGAWDITDFSNITSDLTVTAVYTAIPAGAAMALSAPLSAVKTGDNVAITVAVTGVDAFSSVRFKVNYDPSVLEYVGYTTPFTQKGEDFPSGIVSLALAGDALSSPANVAVVNFEVIGTSAGSSNLTLTNAAYAVTGDATISIANTTPASITVVTNVAPVVSNLSIGGLLFVGEELTANYTFTDADSDADASTYQWYVADAADGTYSEIADATAKTFTLTSDEAGKYIKVIVTPNDGTDAGAPVSYNTTTAVGTIILGDFDGDDVVDINDAVALMAHLAGEELLTAEQLLAANVNGDAAIDSGDVVRILIIVAKR